MPRTTKFTESATVKDFDTVRIHSAKQENTYKHKMKQVM